MEYAWSSGFYAQGLFSLFQAIRQIPGVYYDIKAWENEHENVFTLFRQGEMGGFREGKLGQQVHRMEKMKTRRKDKER